MCRIVHAFYRSWPLPLSVAFRPLAQGRLDHVAARDGRRRDEAGHERTAYAGANHQNQSQESLLGPACILDDTDPEEDQLLTH